MAPLVRCFTIPFSLTSTGLWYFRPNENPLQYVLPLLLFQLTLIFFLTHTIHFLLKRFGFPKLVSEFMAGIILTAFARNRKFANMMFPPHGNNILSTISMFGYSLFLFLISVKMDVSMVTRTGKKAFAIGASALLVPLILGMSSFALINRSLPKKLDDKNYKIIASVTANHALTPFPVIACLLNELKITNSELGRLALSSAFVSDFLSVLLTTVGIYTKEFTDRKSFTGASTTLVLCIGFLLAVVFIFRPAMFWMVRQTPEGIPVKDSYIMIVITMSLLSAICSHYFKLAVLFGPFIFGLAVPDGPPLGSAVVNKLETLVSGFLTPILVTLIGVKATIFFKYGGGTTALNLILVVITYSGKMAAVFFIALYCRMPFKDALALAFIMSSKGIVDFVSFSAFRDSETADEQTYTMMVIIIALVAALVPLAVKSLYDPSRKYAGYGKRTIMHAKPNAELRILVCINSPDDIPGIIKILEASNPSKESPICVNVLHLIELVGRTSPLFISHQLQKQVASNGKSYSEVVLKAFNYYEQHNQGVVTVQAYTTLSALKFMHEDICLLALDKLASLIIIPFHRKLAEDGMILSENQNFRTVNCNVLERSPCSIGILLDRGNFGSSVTTVLSQSAYSVAVLFLGGDDDREALAYGKRMARDFRINLTVIHFTVEQDMCNNVEHDIWNKDWDKMLDEEMLKDVKFNPGGHSNVEYRQQMVRDGAETALAIRSIDNDYDLIMVGRRHKVNSPLTAGLAEWSVFPELGVIGDLFASSDFNSRVSVLVVQQQRYQSTLKK